MEHIQEEKAIMIILVLGNPADDKTIIDDGAMNTVEIRIVA